MAIGCQDAYEWIVANSQGGYALGPADLANGRKYHGLLIAAGAGQKRNHLVAAIEEKIAPASGAAFFCDSNHYWNVIHPEGYKQIVWHCPRPFPSWLYSSAPPSASVLVLKTVQMHPSENVTVVRYKNVGRASMGLTLRPKFTLRDHHACHAPGYWDGARYQCQLQGQTGAICSDGVEAFVYASGGRVAADPAVYRSVVYPTELTRGYDGVEDVIAPYRIELELNPGEEQFLVFGERPGPSMEDAVCRTAQRYGAYALPSHHPGLFEGSPEELLAAAQAAGGNVFQQEQCLKLLELAFSEFFAGDDLIAGYPWFSAWGRDTMIAMEALAHLRGGRERARRILQRYAEALREGRVPNVLGEGAGGRNYDAVDASLWFALRALELREAFERVARAEMVAAAGQVIAHYLYNPSLPFHVDGDDGLIFLRSGSGLALTWMDARVGGEPVTPRYGKPIEVNALWYGVLRLFVLAAQEEAIGAIALGGRSISRADLRLLARKVRASLGAFCDGTSFADRIEEGKPQMELRPNYLIALSLPFEIFTRRQTRLGYDLAREKLLTPYGLRTLSPDHPGFRKNYMGNQRMRDLAYHQGTVWPWLLWPMAQVARKLYGRDRAGLARELEGLVRPFREGLMRGAMASAPELYDGEGPGLPKGAPAQCWSVAAVYLIEKSLEALGTRR